MQLRVMGVIASAWVLSLTLLSPSAVLAAEQDEREKLAKDIKELQIEEVKALEICFQATQASYEAETVTLDVLLMTSRALLKGELRTADNDAQRLEAFQRALKRTQNIERKVYSLFETSSKGGEAKEYYLAKSARLRAEVELKKQQLKIAKKN